MFWWKAEKMKADADSAFFKLIDDIFGDDELPPEAKMIKLSQILVGRPELEAQIRKVQRNWVALSGKASTICLVESGTRAGLPKDPESPGTRKDQNDR